MNRFLAAVSLCALASCSGLTPHGLTPQQNAAVSACVASLPVSMNTSVNTLLEAAKASPACRALAADALQAAVREAMLRAR